MGRRYAEKGRSDGMVWDEKDGRENNLQSDGSGRGWVPGEGRGGVRSDRMGWDGVGSDGMGSDGIG